MMITASKYCEYIQRAAAAIASQGDYVTQLDLATGDGDHWVNIHAGFQALCEIRNELEIGPMDACFKKIGMTLMRQIGGSSGVLYGSGYLAAAKAVGSKESIDLDALFCAMQAMLDAMMARGNAAPGMKTMIDVLAPAIAAYGQYQAEGANQQETLSKVKEAAKNGMEATRDMPAVQGRASYRLAKGVGHLDPGAVTMYIQIKELCDYLCTQ